MEEEDDETFYRNVDLEENAKKQRKLEEEEEEEDEEDGGGQALNFKDGEIIEIPDDTQNDLASDDDDDDDDDDEKGTETVNEGKSFVIKTKDGKTTMIFSGEQQDMAKEVTNNIRNKYERSKKN